MADHKALGMAGTAEFWAGVEKLEAKIKWRRSTAKSWSRRRVRSYRIRSRFAAV